MAFLTVLSSLSLSFFSLYVALMLVNDYALLFSPCLVAYSLNNKLLLPSEEELDRVVVDSSYRYRM
jgi:hypothetical protein